MNKQTKTGIEWSHVFGPDTGYTWNPVGGCQHDCVWKMPDGSSAQCYAKTFAERQRGPKFYPDGFTSHYWHPERLKEPMSLKQPSGIFLDSMSDLMGHWTQTDQIEQVLDVCRRTPQHIYFLLTKAPPRLLKFDFPENVWVGVSMPPSRMMGKALTAGQQTAMLHRSLDVLSQVKATVRWMSFEPLSWDVAADLETWNEPANLPLDWAVIGAATNGAKVYQPDIYWVDNLEKYLANVRPNFPVFYKGNLRGNAAATPWREEFPQLQTVKQQSLF